MVSIYYDPLISKLTTWGKNRSEAIQRMKRALEEYTISGVLTVIPFHKKVMNHPDFINGTFSTHFIQEKLSQISQLSPITHEDIKTMAIVSCLFDHLSKKKNLNRGEKSPSSCWKYENRRRRLFGV
jgi:acetyl/propionyl-CoA carboxylase alpha subunit